MTKKISGDAKSARDYERNEGEAVRNMDLFEQNHRYRREGSPYLARAREYLFLARRYAKNDGQRKHIGTLLERIDRMENITRMAMNLTYGKATEDHQAA